MKEQILGQELSDIDQAPSIAIQLRQVGFSAADIDSIEHPQTHRVRNVGDRELRLIAVINDGEGSVDETSTGGTGDWTDKDYVNRWFRVWRTNLLPSQSEEWHTAGRDLLLVNPYGGRLTVRLQESAASVEPVRDWKLVERGSTFQIANDGGDAVSFISVEIR